MERNYFKSRVILIDIGLAVLALFTRLVSQSVFLHKWDSVQFALALENFDITRHQPHPVGYPGYIGLAWIAKQAVADDNSALVLVGIVSAIISVISLHHIGRMFINPRGGFVAALLAIFNPLMWFFSSVALSYMAGVGAATLAICLTLYLDKKYKWIGPVVGGLSLVIWHGAILIMPAVLWAYLVDEKGGDEGKQPGLNIDWSRILSFIPLIAVPAIIGYIPVIADTGGLGPYLAEIFTESGKHASRFSGWFSHPVTEFLDNTGSLAGLFKQGFGKGRWLFLVLLIPVFGEIGCSSKKVIGLLPLMVAGYVSLHWGTDQFVRLAGIFAFAITVWLILPTPDTVLGWKRRSLLLWWLVPGMILCVLVFINYVGILLVFVPPLIFLEAWAIERAAEFMALQTARGPEDHKVPGSPDDEDEPEKEPVIKGPDKRVEKLVAWVLVGLMVMHDFGAFGMADYNESWAGIRDNDYYFGTVLATMDDIDVPQDKWIVLGGEANYRHMTYYLPDARVIWTKYILYRPVREGIEVWISRNRMQEKVIPDVESRTALSNEEIIDVQAAVFSIDDSAIIVGFPLEAEQFRGDTDILTPYYVDGDPGGEIAFFTLDTDGFEKMVFAGEEGSEYVDEEGLVQIGWDGIPGGWWLE